MISASPDEIVRPLCRYLGIEDVIATRSEVDEDGVYTGQLELYAYGPAKAQAMIEMADHENIDLSESYAYSDSITDLPMLEAVGNPIVVNPDSELAAIAEERGWEVRHFESLRVSYHPEGQAEFEGSARGGSCNGDRGCSRLERSARRPAVSPLLASAVKKAIFRA